MAQIKLLKDIDELQNLIETENFFYLYKHSTICPTSAQAKRNVERFVEANDDCGKKVYLVSVIEQRPLSNHIGEYFNVIHQSPQILLILNGKCIWNASHLAINEEVMEEKLSLI